MWEMFVLFHSLHNLLCLKTKISSVVVINITMNLFLRFIIFLTTFKSFILSVTGEVRKRFQCGVCGKDFSTKWNLQLHSRTHSNIKQFKCAYCNKEFTRKDVWRNHVYIQHMQQTEQGQFQVWSTLWAGNKMQFISRAHTFPSSYSTDKWS